MTYEILCDLGLVALFGGSLAGIVKIVFLQIKGIKLGVKALLRSMMISEYNKAMDKGYARIYSKENFQNCWEQYHAIKGPNGVMDDLHDKYMALPTEPPNDNKGGDENGY